MANLMLSVYYWWADLDDFAKGFVIAFPFLAVIVTGMVVSE